MKSQLIAIVAAVLAVGCGESSQESSTEVKTPYISIHDAARAGSIEVVKQHLDAGTDVNAKDEKGATPLHGAAFTSRMEIVELLIANGADVNAKMSKGWTPLDTAIEFEHSEIADILRKHGPRLP